MLFVYVYVCLCSSLSACLLYSHHMCIIYTYYRDKQILRASNYVAGELLRCCICLVYSVVSLTTPGVCSSFPCAVEHTTGVFSHNAQNRSWTFPAFSVLWCMPKIVFAKGLSWKCEGWFLLWSMRQIFLWEMKMWSMPQALPFSL